MTVMQALNLALVVYVSSVSNLRVLFAVIIGGLYFAEGQIYKRFLGAVVMVAGVLIITPQ